MAKRRVVVFERVSLRFVMGGLSLASVLVTHRASSESASEVGPPPFFCTAASIVATSGALPRNVPAVPMAPSSLLMVSDVRIDIVGASSTITSTVRSDDWNGQSVPTWLVAPNALPEVGDYHLRYEEECARSDGGGYERRRHEVSRPFRFTEAAPLPSVAGNVVVSQSPFGHDPEVVQVWTAGVCEMRRFAAVYLTAEWFPAPQLVPFGEAVLGSGGWRPGLNRPWKGYGEPLSSTAPHRLDSMGFSCNPSRNASFGVVDGRATFTLRTRLAGTSELPPVSTEVQLDCPPSELVGPCSDAGSDAAIDAPYPDTGAPPNPDTAPPNPDTGAPPNPDTGAPDAYVSDTLRLDAHLDRAPPQGPDGGFDTPSDAASIDGSTVDGASSTDTADATDPSGPFDDRDRGGCSVSKLAADRGSPSGPWLLGFMLAAVSALRRRRKGVPVS
jgi:MYXO-CTERM domain-containing protein